MRPQWLPSRTDVPGLALAFAIGGVSVVVARVLPPSPLVSDVLVGMLLGAIVLNTPLASAIGMASAPASARKEREPDRYASGLRFTGKWILRLAIVLMGMKVQTSFFSTKELALVFGVAAASMPSAFFVAHCLGALLGVRRPLSDLLAGGTMICGASAVNAMAPVANARRDEQGVAIAVMFLFSVVAMFTFRAIAAATGLSMADAGLWSGLSVNDLSSAVAVGAQMGESGGVMATASKSARILLLGPVLVALSLVRTRERAQDGPRAGAGLGKTVLDALPGFLLGYVALAIVRAGGDRVFGDAAAWQAAVGVCRVGVDVLMCAVSAGIGLHLALRTILGSSVRAAIVGGGTSVWMAGLTLGMIWLAGRGMSGKAAALGAVALVLAIVPHRLLASRAARERSIRRRFDANELLTLEEATMLLDAADRARAIDDALLRGLLDRLSPAIGELIPARTSPLAHGQGCRWMTYWEGRSGWALVAIVREPGAITPIHAHPHRLLGKAIEGQLEELRFVEREGGELELVSRAVLAHEELVETDGLATIHVVRAVGPVPAIDLQLRGPEVGKAGRVMRPHTPLDLAMLRIGDRVRATEEPDARPGHGGEGAGAGRLPPGAG